jgi:hypothetical protein
MAHGAYETHWSDAVTAMFIFRRSIAGPLVALTLLAALVVADAQFDVNLTLGTKASDVSSSENTTMQAPLENPAQRLAAQIANGSLVEN